MQINSVQFATLPLFFTILGKNIRLHSNSICKNCHIKFISKIHQCHWRSTSRDKYRVVSRVHFDAHRVQESRSIICTGTKCIKISVNINETTNRSDRNGDHTTHANTSNLCSESLHVCTNNTCKQQFEIKKNILWSQVV